MLRLVALSLAISAVLACEDGVDNVIKVFDTTNGKGKILFHDVEIWTYDADKKPSCAGDGASFQLPGNFKVAKGSIEIREGVKEDPSKPHNLALSVEKQSWIIGVVCENGVSKNQFVPNELCKYDLCKLVGDKVCGMLTSKTPKIDVSMFASKDLIDIGPMPIPQLAGDWKISANVLDGKKIVAGIRLGKKNEWLNIETPETGKDAVKMETFEPGSRPQPGAPGHDEF